jgi:formylglycine-generating enzyme
MGAKKTSSVLANPFGLKNMSGNVQEYCSDWYAEDAYSQTAMAVTDPKPFDGDRARYQRGKFCIGTWRVKVGSKIPYRQ